MSEGKRVGARCGNVRRFAGAGQGQAADDIGLLERQPGLPQRLVGRPQHRRKTVRYAETHVGGSGRPLAADLALEVDEAGTATRSAPIYTKK